MSFWEMLLFAFLTILFVAFCTFMVFIFLGVIGSIFGNGDDR